MKLLPLTNLTPEERALLIDSLSPTRLYTIQEAAYYLGLSRQTIYNRRKEGYLTFHLIGKHPKITGRDIKETYRKR